MSMTNSLDLWQKDIFFSAAEEVQASADIMESAYRTWVRQKSEGLSSINLDERCRELQTTLGTAKWQLDEFQRAVTSHYKTRVDETRTKRHQQFVSAIESQISTVEAALKEYFSSEVKRPLRWINLDEGERDDLATFLSGVSGETPETPQSVKGSTESYVVQVSPVEVTSDGSSCQADRKGGSRRTWGSQEVGLLKITVDRTLEQKKPLMFNVESTSKDEGSVWKRRRGNFWINKIFRRAGGSRQLQTSSIHMQRSHSFRLTLVLLLTIFLLVPFVLYSNYA